MTQKITWDIIPGNTVYGIPGASLAETKFVGLYTEPLSSVAPSGATAWGVEMPDFDGGAIHLRAGIAPSAERARAAAEAAAREVEVAVAMLHAMIETPSGLH